MEYRPRASDDDNRRTPDRGGMPGTPRWVKVFGIVALVLVLLVVVLMVAGVGGPHGPGRHLPSGGTGGQTPPVAQGVQRP